MSDQLVKVGVGVGGLFRATGGMWGTDLWTSSESLAGADSVNLLKAGAAIETINPFQVSGSETIGLDLSYYFPVAFGATATLILGVRWYDEYSLLLSSSTAATIEMQGQSAATWLKQTASVTAPALARYARLTVTRAGLTGSAYIDAITVMKAVATLTATTLNATTATVSGALTAGSAAVSGALTAGSAAVSGALTAGSAAVSGALTAASLNTSSGAISGGSISGASVTATGAVSAATVTASGAIAGLVTATGSTTARSLAARAAEVVNVRDYGATGDGATNDTVAIQAAIDAGQGKTVVIPPGTYMVSGLVINGSAYNGTRVIQQGGTLKLRPSGGGTCGGRPAWIGMDVTNCSDITLDLKWDGNRSAQANTQFHHCLTLSGANDVKIPNMEFREIRGDAIFITQSDWSNSSTIPSNISIGRLWAYNTAEDGRNILSIISGRRISVDQLYSYNVGGVIAGETMPGGLDIEPDHSWQLCEDISVGWAHVVTAGTSGLCCNGKSITDDATRDWNIQRVSIKGLLVRTGTSGDGLLPNLLVKCRDVNVDIKSYFATTRGWVFRVDYCDRVTGRLEASNATYGVAVGHYEEARDCKLEVYVSDYSSGGLRTCFVTRCTFSGAIHGASVNTAYGLYCHANSRGAIVQADTTYRVDVTYNATTSGPLRAFRNDPISPVTYTRTVARDCAWLGFSTYATTCDAAVDKVNVKGMNFGATAPTVGTWLVGDVVHNTTPTRGGVLGWTCITAGTPGTWVPMAAVGYGGNLNVRDFAGSTNIGTSGVDATTALNAAITAAGSGLGAGKKIYVPAGTYDLSSTVAIPDSVSIIGEGIHSTVFRKTHTGTMFTMATCSAVENCRIDGNAQAGTIFSIPTANSKWQRLYNVETAGGSGAAIQFAGMAGAAFTALDCDLTTTRTAMSAAAVEITSLDTSACVRRFVNCSSGGTLIDLKNVDNLHLTNCRSEGLMATGTSSGELGGEIFVNGSRFGNAAGAFSAVTLNYLSSAILVGNTWAFTVTLNNCNSCWFMGDLPTQSIGESGTSSGNRIWRDGTYTPTWTGATTNPVLGNEGTIKGEFVRSGRQVTVWIELNTGSDTTYGSGRWSFSLPPGLPAATGSNFSGTAHLVDLSASARYQAIALDLTDTTVGLFFSGGSTSADATTPFPWATGDQVRIQFTYMTN